MSKCANSYRWTCCSFAIAAGISFSSAANAQDEALEVNQGEARIIVTARRQEENLQDTPVAITALSGAQLENRQILDVQDLQSAVPNMTIATYPGDPASVSIQLRGQVQSDLVATNDPAVAVYLDGVYLGRGNSGSLNLLDMQRVEVLRGPQGTLFGRNTTGGAINIVPNAPTNRFEGWVSSRVGNYNLYEVTGLINVPLGDTFAARVVGQHSQNDGYMTSRRTGRDFLDNNSDAFRATLLFEPTDNLHIQLTGDYSSLEGNGAGFKLIGVNPNHAVNFFPILLPTIDGGQPVNNYVDGDIYHNESQRTDSFYSAEIWGVTGMIALDIGDAELKSITAYRELSRDAAFDYDGTPYIVLEADSVDLDQYQISQEFQLNGTAFNDALSYAFGAFYFRERAIDITRNDAFIGLSAPPFRRGVTDGTATNISYALYGQFTYEFLPDTHVTAGLRYTWDERRLVNRNRSTFSTVYDGPVVSTACSLTPSVLDDPSVCQVSLSASYNYLSYSFGVDHQFDNFLLYARTGRAYKSGGYNNRASNIPEAFAPFDPERLTDYEVGVKYETNDRRFHANLAAFYSDYRNMQRTLAVVTPGGQNPSANITTNAQSAHITGLEFEFGAVPTRGLNVGLSFGYLNPQYDVYQDLAPPFADRSNEPFIFVSKFTVGASINYEFSTRIGEWRISADYSTRSEFYFVAADARPQEDYGTGNASIAFRPAGLPNLEVGAWVQNVFDEEYFINVTDLLPAVGIAAATPGAPRTYGLSVSFNF